MQAPNFGKGIVAAVEEYFYFSKHNARWGTEVLAGTSTFASLVYIFIVTPTILQLAGMDLVSVLYAAIIISSISTIAMGIFARLPFALAPGLEMSTYVAFTVVGLLGFDWRQALAMIFLSSLLFVILTIAKVRDTLIDQVPVKLKHAITFSIGLFLVVVSLNLIGVFDYSRGFLTVSSVELNLTFYSVMIGLAVTFFFSRVGFSGSILLGILVCGLIQIFAGDPTAYNPGFEDFRLTNANAINLQSLSSIVFSVQAMIVVLTLFLIDFYGSVAKFIGLLEGKSMSSDLRERAPRALSLDGIATFFGSFLGVTSITTFVESGVGINVGGRTGVTAIVCGLLMILVLFLAPYILMIPATATVPALTYIGFKIMRTLPLGEGLDNFDWLIITVMSGLVIIDFSLFTALSTGFLGYAVKNVLRVYSHKIEFVNVRLNWILILSAIILGCFLVLGWLFGINRA
ncbi:NCS2 family permease [Pontixanthobacter sp. CEM42]|uniref:solute carrier family 23 protein n=1 Tax=Pontixanthobacter sp. CEM42 TaxID=2792077 RepID=UPI001ADFBDE0